MVYQYTRQPAVKSKSTWDVAFHGTWWYSIWLILESGVLLESSDYGLGHDFLKNSPGVYCTPMTETARTYARPHVIFGDGVYHRVMLELRVNTERRKRNRKKGGVQWVFNSDAVSLHALWVQRNAPPARHEERVNEWDPELEARPAGRDPGPPIVNPRKGPWPKIPHNTDLRSSAVPRGSLAARGSLGTAQPQSSVGTREAARSRSPRRDGAAVEAVKRTPHWWRLPHW